LTAKAAAFSALTIEARSFASLLGSLGERKPSFGHFDEKGLMC